MRSILSSLVFLIPLSNKSQHYPRYTDGNISSRPFHLSFGTTTLTRLQYLYSIYEAAGTCPEGEKKSAVNEHFKTKSWEQTYNSVSKNTEVNHSRATLMILSMIYSKDFHSYRKHDSKGDNRLSQKWKRTQRWKDGESDALTSQLDRASIRLWTLQDLVLYPVTHNYG